MRIEDNCTCREAESRLAVGMPSSFDPRPKPLTTVPLRVQGGSTGTSSPHILSSKGGRPYSSGAKSYRDASVAQQPAQHGQPFLYNKAPFGKPKTLMSLWPTDDAGSPFTDLYMVLIA